MATKSCFVCLTALLFIVPSECAPKKGRRGDSKLHTVYDQKQTGDYNIQLHLKDFQIIALLGDDAANFGDYDYSYDYSDFTIKPATQKPTESSISSLPAIGSSSTSKPPTRPPYQPYPFIPSSTQKPQQPILEGKPSSSEKPATNKEPPIVEQLINEKPLDNEQSLSNEKPVINEQLITLGENIDSLTLNPNATISNTSTTQKSQKLDDMSSPGKIKVQIIETPVRMGVVPGEDLPEKNETLPQGEILHLRRCATGFTRDKRGRCRRVRRPGNVQPQLSYGFSRLASNLASRLRQTSEDSSASSSESKED